MIAQAFQNRDQVGMMAGRKTLESNPNHTVIQESASTTDEAEKPEYVQDGSVIVDTQSGRRQDSCVGHDLERQGEGCQEKDSEQNVL